MKHALLVGLGGIGSSVYLPQLERLGYTVYTVDVNVGLNPTFTDISQVDGNYEVGVICVPNYLHKTMAEQVAPICDTLFIEKPGLVNAEEWQQLLDKFPTKKICMVKNNLYREGWYRIEEGVKEVDICWLNKDRVPNPGSWFTEKEKAFGGVAYDLMPHLLCYLELLIGHQIHELTPTYHFQQQRYTMDDMTSTDYGAIDVNGVYDVCDYAELRYTLGEIDIRLIASWKEGIDDCSIKFRYEDGTEKIIGFGLCPDNVYGDMIKLNAVELYDYHKKLDLFIHKTLELFK